MRASNEGKPKVRSVGRTLFFLVGVCGLLLLISGFWLDTAKLGGILCAGALIGHMATWAALPKSEKLD